MKVYSRIFWHIQTYLNISKAQASSEPSVTLAYLEPWHIQNKKHILSRDILRTVAYSELWYIQNPVKHLLWSVFAKIVNVYNYFDSISFSSFLLYEKYYFFNTGLICIPEVFIPCKVWGLMEPREPGERGGGRVWP